METAQGIETTYRGLFDDESGLPTSVLLRDRVEVGLRRARRINGYLLIVWVELEDETARPPNVAPTVARRLEEALRPDDTVARVTDRDFVVACNDLLDESAADSIVRRLHHAITQPVDLTDTASELVTRVGMTLASPGQSAASVIEAARASVESLLEFDRAHAVPPAPRRMDLGFERINRRDPGGRVH